MSLPSSWCSPSSLAWRGGIAGIALLLCILGVKLFRRYKRTERKVDPSQKSIAHIFDEALQKFSSSDNSSSLLIKDVEQLETNRDSNNVFLLSGADALIELEDITVTSFPSCSLVNRYDRVIERVESDNLRGLIKERIADFSIEGLSIEKWALGVVDFMDEISWMSDSCSSRDVRVLRDLVKQMKALLSSMDCIPIDEDLWTQENQRAVSVKEVLPKGASPRIIKKGSTGLIVQGKLIRKQEVYLETSPTI
ncbi:hypothetical protein [Akkermansia muciniphila]|uniref:hypothetical protein n=1 Tax=Akkermansia muciniphila TaxID=239935 RepID=UPI001BFFA2A9|nr:hypothetical protein [Akkermansia muciniphila]MBT8792739.1 hypothetical protein [Akkermansia muciniphila]